MSAGAVVVAEDEAATRALVARLLEMGGYVPLPVEDGASCLALLSRVRPKAVLLDVQMPGLSGLGVLRAMRADPRWTEIPVLFVTARVDRDLIETVRGSRNVGVVAKPFPPTDLVPRLQRQMAMARTAAV
jgi:CheY-like chemotaxis protein